MLTLTGGLQHRHDGDGVVDRLGVGGQETVEERGRRNGSQSALGDAHVLQAPEVVKRPA